MKSNLCPSRQYRVKSKIMVKKTGIALITAERVRQVTEEGWTPEHDEQHERHALASAAECYLNRAFYTGPFEGPPDGMPRWPWDLAWWKPVKDDGGIRNLVKAGALIAAEIDRIQNET